MLVVVQENHVHVVTADQEVDLKVGLVQKAEVYPEDLVVVVVVAADPENHVLGAEVDQVQEHLDLVAAADLVVAVDPVIVAEVDLLKVALAVEVDQEVFLDLAVAVFHEVEVVLVLYQDQGHDHNLELDLDLDHVQCPDHVLVQFLDHVLDLNQDHEVVQVHLVVGRKKSCT